MKKIILSSILFSSLVFSEQIRIIPMDKSLLAHENGGNKPAIEAYSDGVGLFTESNQFIDNSPMNELVYKYGEKAKNEGSTLKDYSLNNGTDEEKDLANKLGKLQQKLEGLSCNDGDVQTINDTYNADEICVGMNVEGQSCDDNNNETYNDKYISGLCIGIPNTKIGDSCNDNNTLTENDVYIDTVGTCKGVRTYNSIQCEGEPIGSSILVNGISYLVVSNSTLKTNLGRAETLCTSNVTDMGGLFTDNKTFNQDISKWDTSNVTDMKNMFLRSNFNGNIGDWNVSKVKYMYGMFYSATEFNKPIGNWDLSSVINMNRMFGGALSFNQDISKWNTSNVTDMYEMFNSALKFNQDLSGWCVSKITSEPITANSSIGIFFDSRTPEWVKPNRQPIWGTCP